jgi:hypothetical protein
MKLKTILLFTVLVLTTKTNLLYSGLIHKDPYDIKRASLSLAPVYAGPRGFGAFTMANFYINNKLMLYYSGHYFPMATSEAKYFDAEPNMSFITNKKDKMTMYNAFGLDWHFSDRKVDKKTQVLLSSYTSGAGSFRTTTNTMVEVQTYKRKVWTLYAGILAQTGRERFYKDNVDKASSYKLLNNTTGTNIDIADRYGANFGRSVFANASIYNLELGLRNKGIFATCYKDNRYGKKYQDAHAEWYILAVLPVASSFEKDVYRNGNTATKYTIIENTKPKPGFKIGFNFRTSLKSNFYMGGDFGYLPSLVTGTVMHFSGRLGYNINFGKVHYDTEPAPKSSE